MANLELDIPLISNEGLVIIHTCAKALLHGLVYNMPVYTTTSICRKMLKDSSMEAEAFCDAIEHAGYARINAGFQANRGQGLHAIKKAEDLTEKFSAYVDTLRKALKDLED
jgi:hypothetical protein